MNARNKMYERNNDTSQLRTCLLLLDRFCPLLKGFRYSQVIFRWKIVHTLKQIAHCVGVHYSQVCYIFRDVK